jgi:3D (Asp-Asp-Asp) domain-containing protein
MDIGMKQIRVGRFSLIALAAMVGLWSFPAPSYPHVVSTYVTFYGFDDNDDGDPTHLGTAAISDGIVHTSATEDMGTYARPGTLATDTRFLAPGTKVYVPALKRYYVMEDTCVECSADWVHNKRHVDLYVAGSGDELLRCEERLTMESAKIVVSPPAGLPVKPGSACD